MYIPLPFSCWHRISTSAVMAMKSCSLEWADHMSRTPQRCSGMSNQGSPVDCRKFDGHVDVLVLLHVLYFLIIHCVVRFLLNQSFKHSDLVEDSIRSYHMILQYLVSFVSREHLCGRFKAECQGLILDDGGSAREGRWLHVMTYRRWLSLS